MKMKLFSMAIYYLLIFLITQIKSSRHLRNLNEQNNNLIQIELTKKSDTSKLNSNAIALINSRKAKEIFNNNKSDVKTMLTTVKSPELVENQLNLSRINFRDSQDQLEQKTKEVEMTVDFEDQKNAKNTPTTQPKSDTEVFTHIYSNNIWGNGSGAGSAYDNTTQYRNFLQSFLDNNKASINTIVDIGCGDWQIMRHISIPPKTQYLGLDVVESVIAQDKAQFRKSNINFKLIKNESEVGSGDLLIAKDVLQHWPNSKVEAFYQSVKNRFKYVLITNCYKNDIYKGVTNGDISLGDFRTLDLTQSPFNHKELDLVLEYSGGGFKRTYLLDNTKTK